MAWTNITTLETAPGARILKSLMFRMRDNPIYVADQTSIGVPADERPRLPECLRTAETSIQKALASNGVGNVCKFITSAKWHLAAFQTPGAWNISGVAARTYFVEMWGAGCSGNTTATNRGGGSGAYTSVVQAAGAGVAIGGVVGTGGAAGAAGWLAGTNTTLATGPGTATAPGAPATGAGAALGVTGGTAALVIALAGIASQTTGSDAFSSFGAPAPMLGGNGPRRAFTGVTRATPGSGGVGIAGAGGNSQAGGHGMVLVWYLE